MQIDKNFIIGLGTLGLLAAVFAYWFGSRSGKASVALPTETGAAAKEVNPHNLTYEASTYSAQANKLYDAISLGPVWVDSSTVNTVFTKMKTPDDILQLITSFGNHGVWFMSGTLTEWLYQGLSTRQLKDVNDILKQNGNTYQF